MYAVTISFTKLFKSFADQLSEVDIAAVIHYKRNSWGNDMNDIVQPLDILNYKQSR